MALREIIKRGTLSSRNTAIRSHASIKAVGSAGRHAGDLAQANRLGLAAPRWASCAERSWWSTTRRRCWS